MILSMCFSLNVTASQDFLVQILLVLKLIYHLQNGKKRILEHYLDNTMWKASSNN